MIDPPLVVAIGPPNIGKSSLLNALAGRSVALVADEAGTTRDHVGVMLDLAGLAVRYIDSPGIAPVNAAVKMDEIGAEATAIAMGLARQADLVLLACDASSGFAAWPTSEDVILRVALRADLGLPKFPDGGGERAPIDVAVSARTGEGVPALVAAIRERLIPSAALAHPGPWRFWSHPASTAPAPTLMVRKNGGSTLGGD